MVRSGLLLLLLYTVKPCYNELQGRKKFVITKFVIVRVLPKRKTLAENRGFLIGSLKREVRYTDGSLYQGLTVARLPEKIAKLIGVFVWARHLSHSV